MARASDKKPEQYLGCGPDPTDQDTTAAPRRRPDILVVGGSGLVGSALLRLYGPRAVGTCWHTPEADLLPLDIGDTAAVDALIERLAPRLVLHHAALTDVDRCEVDVEDSYRINVLGTANVARAAERVGARHLYFSTDYVFDGETGPAPIDAPPNPINVYGRHKLEAETFVREHHSDFAIVRVCGVYGYHPRGKNFVMALLDKGRRGEPMRVPSDQWGTPTYVTNLAEATAELAELDFVGIAHLSGPDFMARIDLARLAAEVLGLDPSFLRPTPTSELEQRARRPINGGVDNRGTQALLRTRLLPAHEGLLAFKEEMKRRG